MKIFLSAVSAQFKPCRDALRSDLAAVGAGVVVQEDFIQHGGTLLQKLEQYIDDCDRVIALVGSAYGWQPEDAAIPAGAPSRSYTQWEYYFARGERLDGSIVRSKPTYVYFATQDYLHTLPGIVQEEVEYQRQQGRCQTNSNSPQKTKSGNFAYAAQSPLHSESELLRCCLKISRFCKCRWWLKWL